MTEELSELRLRELQVRQARLALARERKDRFTREAGLAMQVSAGLALVLPVALVATLASALVRRPLTAAGIATGALAWVAIASIIGSAIREGRIWAIDLAIGCAGLATLGGLGVLVFGPSDGNQLELIVFAGLPLAATVRFVQTRSAMTAAAALERELNEAAGHE